MFQKINWGFYGFYTICQIRVEHSLNMWGRRPTGERNRGYGGGMLKRQWREHQNAAQRRCDGEIPFPGLIPTEYDIYTPGLNFRSQKCPWVYGNFFIVLSMHTNGVMMGWTVLSIFVKVFSLWFLVQIAYADNVFALSFVSMAIYLELIVIRLCVVFWSLVAMSFNPRGN
jgi:hypothetical protein